MQTGSVVVEHPLTIVAVCLFGAAYALVICEEIVRLRKSKPVLLAGGLIWILIGYMAVTGILPHGNPEHALRTTLIEYAELLLFLLVAMTYIHALTERNVFEALRVWLVNKKLGYPGMFWLTGTVAFFVSPIADNLTTALLMGGVVLAVGGTNTKFIAPACTNVVIAANAGGVISPFGDITTLMVWQSGALPFQAFFTLFIPAVVNWLVPALIMSRFLPKEVAGCREVSGANEYAKIHRGGLCIALLLLATIGTAVATHHFLHLPAVLGMLIGLTYLQFFGFYLRITHGRSNGASEESIEVGYPFDVFALKARIEWDTLLFFCGVMLCVGGMAHLGYLTLVSTLAYEGLGPDITNIAVGLVSAVVDNIPVMYAVLQMNPEMSDGQWLLVTLTAGVGGSFLSVGSAAGVALMGQAREHYTFFSHLRWTPAIGLGYLGSIASHYALNQSYF